MASPPAVHVHRRLALPAARHASVIEIDAPNDPCGTGQIDRAAARVLLEIQPRSGRERLAVPERDLHVEQLQVPARDDEADAPEPAFTRGQEDVVIQAEVRSEEHTSELQSPCNLVCRLLLEKKKKKKRTIL